MSRPELTLFLWAASFVSLAVVVTGLSLWLFGGETDQTTPGWYSDPWNDDDLRWWDGDDWTIHTAPVMVTR